MTSLKPVDETRHPVDAGYDSVHAIQIVGETIADLYKTKDRLELSIASDLEHAKAAYTLSRRKEAIKYMQRVHSNKVFRGNISAAIFQLIAVRIELEIKENQPVLVKKLDQLINTTIGRLEAFQCRPVSEVVLARKLARMVGPVVKARPAVMLY